MAELLFGLAFLGRQKSSDRAAEMSAQQAQRSAEQVEAALAQLEERFDKLSVITMALWSLLKEKNGLSDDDLSKEIAVVEAKRQQEAAEQPLSCPQCGRAMLARARRCLYCEYRTPDGDVFTQVNR